MSAIKEVDQHQMIRIIGSDNRPHFLHKFPENVDQMTQEKMEADWLRYQGLAALSIHDENNFETISFNLFYTMRGIAESLEAGVLDNQKEVLFGDNLNGTFKYSARFVTERIGMKSAKTILMFENSSEENRTELFRINVMPSPVNEFNVRNGNKYPGGPAEDKYTLTAKDNALLQHLSGVLRQKVDSHG